jgi:hypothetical protein
LKKEIKHAARLSREIKGWKETEYSEWGGGGGRREKGTTLQKLKTKI